MLVAAASRRMSPPTAPAPPAPVVLIRSSAYASLPSPGNRVGTGDASNMPTIQATTGNNAILTADGAHHYRLVGLQIKAPTTLLQGSIVKIGGGETTLAEFPTDITIDRCLIRGDPTVGARRGVQLDGIRCAVIDSYIDNCKEDASDTQAVWAYNTPGPLKIVNNYCEASGENIMFGGADAVYSNSVPSDVEIRRNHLKKPTAWIGLGWQVKNNLEFKNAQRVLCEGNVLENTWPAESDQPGTGFLITVRNQDGGAPWSVTQDITFRFNKTINTQGGVNISGIDGNPSLETTRITLSDNLFVSTVLYAGGTQRSWSTVNGPDSVEIVNNTFIITDATGAVGYMSGEVSGSGLTVKNNVFIQREYGILGDAVGTGTVGFNAYFTSWSYTYNMMVGGASGSYPGSSGNLFPANTTAAKFTNYAGGDYSLASDSPGHNAGSDGTDMGADFSLLNTAIANTTDGQWGSEPATYSDRTYTNAELPRSYVDTRYAAQTGTTWNCTTAAEFTTALAGCAVGDTIVLTAGNTFTGSFTLRNI